MINLTDNRVMNKFIIHFKVIIHNRISPVRTDTVYATNRTDAIGMFHELMNGISVEIVDVV